MGDEHDLVAVARDPLPVVRSTYGDAPSQFGDLILPEGDSPLEDDDGRRPVLMLIHGGFWRREWGLELMDAMAHEAARFGFAAWNVEYRRLGEDGGGWPGTMTDASAAIDHLRTLADEHRLDLDRIAVIGHSAGGQLALWLGSRPRWPLDRLEAFIGDVHHPYGPGPLAPRSVIAQAPVADLIEGWHADLGDGENAVGNLLGASPEEEPEIYWAASPSALLPLVSRQVVLQGTDDTSVPRALTRRYIDLVRQCGEPVTYHELVDTDHFQIIDPYHWSWQRQLDAVIESLA